MHPAFIYTSFHALTILDLITKYFKSRAKQLFGTGDEIYKILIRRFCCPLSNYHLDHYHFRRQFFGLI